MHIVTEISTVIPDGAQDLAHLDRALRAYHSARSRLAASGRAVVLVNATNESKFAVETAADLRILLFAAAAAYRGARSDGSRAAADQAIAAMQTSDADDDWLHIVPSPLTLPWG